MDKETGQVSRVACYSIPLYTTLQTKPEGYGKAVPLSNEEIEEIYQKTEQRRISNAKLLRDKILVENTIKKIHKRLKFSMT